MKIFINNHFKLMKQHLHFPPTVCAFHQMDSFIVTNQPERGNHSYKYMRMKHATV